MNETASGCAASLGAFFLARLWEATAALGSRSKGFLPRAALGCGYALAGDHGRAYRGLHGLAKGGGERAGGRAPMEPAGECGPPTEPAPRGRSADISEDMASGLCDAAAYLVLIRWKAESLDDIQAHREAV